jgi:hypothetical protein
VVVILVLINFLVCDIIILLYLNEIDIFKIACRAAKPNNSEGTLTPLKSFVYLLIFWAWSLIIPALWSPGKWVHVSAHKIILSGLSRSRLKHLTSAQKVTCCLGTTLCFFIKTQSADVSFYNSLINPLSKIYILAKENVAKCPCESSSIQIFT